MAGKIAKTVQQIQTLAPGDDLQAAVDQAQDWGVVQLNPIHRAPAGQTTALYRLDRPWLCRGQQHLTVEGLGARDGGRIEVGKSFLGPIAYFGPVTRSLPLAPPLAAG